MTRGMVEKEELPGDTVDAEQPGATGHADWPTPKEGLRLMHAFCRIRQAPIRDAIIRYVEEQSTLHKDD